MLIKDFCEKFGVSKRNVDYWTSIGLLHPEVHENGYRDYGDQAECELGYIFIALMMNRPGSLRDAVDSIRKYNEKQWWKCIYDMQNRHSTLSEQFDIAYRIAKKRLEEVE